MDGEPTSPPLVTPVSMAPSKLVPLMLAFVRLAPVRSAFVRLAPSRLQPVRSAPGPATQVGTAAAPVRRPVEAAIVTKAVTIATAIFTPEVNVQRSPSVKHAAVNQGTWGSRPPPMTRVTAGATSEEAKCWDGPRRP